jgi:hypothetical protein
MNFEMSFKNSSVQEITPVLFQKRIVAELSEAEMPGTYGGTTPICVITGVSSGWCVGGAYAVGAFVGGAVIGYLVSQ